MQFGIIGSGSWATALAKILTDNKNTINWWFRNKENIKFFKKRHHNPHYLNSTIFNPQQINLSSNLEAVIRKSDVVLIAMPSAFIKNTFDSLPAGIFKNKQIISAVKGIIPGKNQFLNVYLNDKFKVDAKNYFSVMGPCHAEEIAAEKLSYLTFSGIDTNETKKIAANFKNTYLNTCINNDIEGSQFASVIKNIYAIGAGIAHGLEYGDNFLSVYIANCGKELFRYLSSLHPEDKTDFTESVYLGDLLVTCYSLYSRNRTFGNMLGKGYSVKAAQLEMNMIAEGYYATKCIYQITKKSPIPLPIIHTIYQILWGNLSAKKGFKMLEKILV